jgi:hypothetical protein
MADFVHSPAGGIPILEASPYLVIADGLLFLLKFQDRAVLKFQSVNDLWCRLAGYFLKETLFF